MIHYEFGNYGFSFLFRCHGSVFPKGCMMALPSALFAVILWTYFKDDKLKPRVEGVQTLFSTYTFVLGFLLVFRTQIAYSRFWEGGSILQEMRGVWLNAASNLVAFSSCDAAKKVDVACFHNLLVRLMSMMHSCALQEVADLDNQDFEIFSLWGIDQEHLSFLASLDTAGDRVEVLLQWVQRLTVNSQTSGVLAIAPPILSRVFQELSNGVLRYHGAKTIRDFPFPFPYGQMLGAMLMIHWLLAPLMASLMVDDPFSAFFATFIPVFSLWCINYIAGEIEMPYGDDANDLPMHEMQMGFNRSLRRLMIPLVQTSPTFRLDADSEDLVQRKGTPGMKLNSRTTMKQALDPDELLLAPRNSIGSSPSAGSDLIDVPPSFTNNSESTGANDKANSPCSADSSPCAADSNGEENKCDVEEYEENEKTFMEQMEEAATPNLGVHEEMCEAMTFETVPDVRRENYPKWRFAPSCLRADCDVQLEASTELLHSGLENKHADIHPKFPEDMVMTMKTNAQNTKCAQSGHYLGGLI